MTSDFNIINNITMQSKLWIKQYNDVCIATSFTKYARYAHTLLSLTNYNAFVYAWVNKHPCIQDTVFSIGYFQFYCIREFIILGSKYFPDL